MYWFIELLQPEFPDLDESFLDILKLPISIRKERIQAKDQNQDWMFRIDDIPPSSNYSRENLSEFRYETQRIFQNEIISLESTKYFDHDLSSKLLNSKLRKKIKVPKIKNILGQNCMNLTKKKLYLRRNSLKSRKQGNKKKYEK
jgi:hypothetical protein